MITYLLRFRYLAVVVILCNIFNACALLSEADAFAADDIGLEGVQWHLVEIGGIPVSSQPGQKHPYLMFDALQKKATGFAGCNNFFSTYEINDALLKFGPIGSSRRGCPENEMALETQILKALENTRAWKIRDEMLLLFDKEEILICFTSLKSDESLPDLGTMTFMSAWLPSGRVTLSRGEYRKPAAPDSTSEIIVKLSPHKAFGVLNGIETGAVITVTSAGGTGTFYDLALLSKEAEGWVNTDRVLLGDRVSVHSVKINDNAIVIDMTTHGPDDPMCCPAHRVLKRFTVREGRLSSAGERAAERDTQITGPAWQWVQTLYNNGKRSLPAKPENFTIQFLENGKVNVKADCNLKAGKYSTDGKRLSIELTQSTMAACEEGSLEEQFVIDLTASANYFFKGGYLYIDLKYDTGTMKFTGGNIWKE